LHLGNAAAAIPYLRLALVYAPRDPYVHERLSRAWAATGDDHRAEGVLAAGLVAEPYDPWLNLLAGERHMVRREFFDAVPALQVAYNAPVTQAAAAPLLVDALLWLGDPRAAAMAEHAAYVHPEDAELGLSLAAVLEDHGDLEAALSLVQMARRQRPALRVGAFAESRLRELLGQPQQAAEALVPLFSFYPDEPELYVAVARLFFRAGNREGEAFRDEALLQAGEDPALRTLVAVGDLVEGRSAVGVTLLRTTLEAYPEAIDTRLYLAETLLHLGDAKGCLDTLNDVALAPEVRRAGLRAECHAALGELPLAMEAAVWAVSVSPRPLETLFEVTRWLAIFAPEAEALEALEALVSRATGSLGAQAGVWARASLLDWLGRSGEALVLLDHLREAEPDDPLLVARLADVYLHQGQIPKALALLREQMERQPDNPIALNAWGFTAAEAGLTLVEAEVMVRRAHRLAPEEGFIVDSLGWVLFKRGDASAALPLLQRANRELPGDAEVLGHLVEVYRALGRLDSARAALAAALVSSPTPVLKQQLLQSVQALDFKP